MGFVHRRRRGAEPFLLVLAHAVGIGVPRMDPADDSAADSEHSHVVKLR